MRRTLFQTVPEGGLIAAWIAVAADLHAARVLVPGPWGAIGLGVERRRKFPFINFYTISEWHENHILSS